MPSSREVKKDVFDLIRQKMRIEDSRLESYADDEEMQRAASSRLKVLRKQLEKLEARGRLSEKTLFLSYSTSIEENHLSYIKNRASFHDFHIKDAYADYNSDPKIIANVRQGIEECFFFLGVLTPRKDLRIIENNGDIKYMPSIWLIEEKGMALAMAKRFRLLIDKNVHEAAWRSVNAETLHYFFDETNFRENVDKVLDSLNREYKNYLKERYSYLSI